VSLTNICISIFIFLIPFQFYFNIYHQVTISVVKLIAGILILISLRKLVREPERIARFDVLFIWCTGAFIALMGASILASDHTLVSIKYFVKWVSIICVSIIAMVNVDSIDDIKRYLAWFLFSAFIVSIIAIIESLAGVDLVFTWISHSYLAQSIIDADGFAAGIAGIHENLNWVVISPDGTREVRAFGTFLSSISLPLFLGFSLSFTPWFFVSFTKRTRVLACSAIMLCLVAIFLGYARSAYISAGIVVFMNVLIMLRQLSSKYRIRLYLVLGVILCMMIVIPSRSRDTIAYRMIAKPPATRYSRPVLWRNAVKIITARPVRGVGLANYDSGFKRFVIDNKDIPPAPAHNDLLQITAEIGLIGGVLYVMLWSIIVYYAVRSTLMSTGTTTRYLGLGFLGAWIWFNVQGIFHNNIFDDKLSMCLWFLMAMNVRLYQILRSSGESSIVAHKTLK